MFSISISCTYFFPNVSFPVIAETIPNAILLMIPKGLKNPKILIPMHIIDGIESFKENGYAWFFRNCKYDSIIEPPP